MGACGEVEPEAASEVTRDTDAASTEATEASGGPDGSVRCDEYFAVEDGDEHTDGIIPDDEVHPDGWRAVYEDLEQWQDETVTTVLDELSPPPLDDIVLPDEDQTPDGTAWYTGEDAVTQHLGAQQTEVCSYLDQQVETAQYTIEDAFGDLSQEQRDTFGPDWVARHGAYLVFHDHLGGTGDGLPVAFAESCHGEADAWFEGAVAG